MIKRLTCFLQCMFCNFSRKQGGHSNTKQASFWIFSSQKTLEQVDFVYNGDKYMGNVNTDT